MAGADVVRRCHSCKRELHAALPYWQYHGGPHDLDYVYCVDCVTFNAERLRAISAALGGRLSAELAGKALPPWPSGIGPAPWDGYGQADGEEPVKGAKRAP